ncbi:MAG: SusC/RagA family TonB-linked outer membrane protein [Cytophagaceae bacterium]|nr:SusC/RagA family TonB-linked outer membrane protein [Cytophagaceae bacterium]
MFNFYIKRETLPVLILMVTWSIWGFSGAYAQEQSTASVKISGVTQDSYGTPVADVKLLDASETLITTSDANGYFEISDFAGSQLLFEHPGYNTQRLSLNYLTSQGQDVLKIKLVEKFLKKTNELDVLYDTRNKDQYLGATATIYNNQLTTTLAPTYMYSLAGRLTGLHTEQGRGMRNPETVSNANQDLIGSIPVNGNAAPSDNTEFFLNLRGQSPVIVIDGVQRNISSIDPETIESISVQKDALSSILLGMRSSRGVLLVTTKKPDKEGFEVSFTGQAGIQQIEQTPNPLPSYQYAYLLNEALQNDGSAPVYTPADFDGYRNGSDRYLYPDNNWFDQALNKTAPISSYNLNIKGGGEMAKYYVGLGYFNQEGHFKTSDANSYDTNLSLDRYLITTKLAIEVTDDLDLGLSLFGRIEDGIQPGAGVSTILSSIYSTPNNAYPVYNPDGSYGGNVSFNNNIMSQTINSGYIKDTKKDAIASINLDYDLGKFVDGLSIEALSNISTQNRSATVRNKRALVYEYIPGKDGDENKYSPFGILNSQVNNFVSVSSTRYWYGQLALNYEQDFGMHSLDAKLLGDMYVISLNYDLPQKPKDLAADVKYDYDDRYFLEAAVNYSYFNRYRPGNQWGLFYAFGAGWDISQEAFLDDVTWLDKLKLRAVYGKTGNGIDNSGYYTWRQSFQESPVTNIYLQGYSDALGNGTFENTPLANPDITWEKAHKVSVGLDASLFDNKLQFTADYYRDKYYDLLQLRGRTIALIGVDYPVENIGENLYTGFETTVTYQDNVGDFNYFVTANWSLQDSEVLFMDEQFRQEDYNRRTGQPVGTRFGLVADGFFNSVEEIEQSATIENFAVQPGDIRYKDLNNDGVIDQFDQTAIAGTKPLTYYGLNAGFSYKGFDFSMMFQGVYNRDIYVSDNVLLAGFQGVGQTYGQAYEPIINRWTPETADTATYPRLTAGGNAYNSNPNFWSTSFWVKSGDYLRLRNVSMAYTLPAHLTKGFFDSRVKIFINGSNLLTFSKYDLVDPEVTNFSNYPLLRTISGGLNLKF